MIDRTEANIGRSMKIFENMKSAFDVKQRAFDQFALGCDAAGCRVGATFAPARARWRPSTIT